MISLTLRRGLFLLTPLLFLTTGAWAASGSDPSGGTRRDDPNTERLNQRDVSGDVVTPMREATPAVVISGTIKNSGGTPVNGVKVKLFSNGILIKGAISDGDGTFSLDANEMQNEKDTAILWFESANADRYLDTSVLLNAGDVATERGLFSPCTKSIRTLGGSAKVEVTMITPAEQKDYLTTLGCLQ